MLSRDRTHIDPAALGLFGVLIFNAVLKWRYFSGLALADDFTYGVYAYSLFRDGYSWDMNLDFRALRFSLILPVAILFQFLPPAEFVAVVYPMLLSFGTIVLIYRIGSHVANPLAGVFGAAFFSMFTSDLRFGTMLMPDVVVPFFVTLAVYAFLKAEDTNIMKWSRIWYLISGIAVFLAFNARENTYYFALFYLPFAFKKERWQKGFWAVAAGFIVPVVLLYSFYFIKTGDFLYNLHLAQKYRDPLIESGYIPSNKISWIANAYFMFPGLFLMLTGKPGFIDSVFGLTFTLGAPFLIIATVRALRKHDRRFLIIPWWFLAGYLFLEYGSISFTEYQMMKKLPRFLLIITPALAIAGGVVLATIFKWIRRKWRAQKRGPSFWASVSGMVLLIGGTVYVSVNIMAMAHANDIVQMTKYRWAAYDVLKNMPRRPVYQTGGWWPNKLSWYLLPDARFIDVRWRRSEMIRDLMAVEDPSELDGSYVIIDRSHFTDQNSANITHAYESFGGYVTAPPDEWQLLGAEEGVEIYEVPQGFVYSEPDGKTLALRTFQHGIEFRDLLLTIYAMHPDFIQNIEVNDFLKFMEIMIDPDSPDRVRVMNSVTYRQYNGRWKLMFHIEFQ